jgi:8-oxo-dGTP pyrophosphatase MutT (NUDIX family)
MMRRSMQVTPSNDLARDFREYAMRWPDEAATASLFGDLLDDGADAFVRERLAGHFTASSWLVSADGTRTLLTHHRKLGLWLQLGGHADGERDLRIAALKEAQEESGLPGLSIESGIFDLDRHWIPEHKGVPAHWHYDVRYVVRAGAEEDYVVSDESHDLAWRSIAGLAGDAGADASVRRMARKWVARLRGTLR